MQMFSFRFVNLMLFIDSLFHENGNSLALFKLPFGSCATPYKNKKGHP